MLTGFMFAVLLGAASPASAAASTLPAPTPQFRRFGTAEGLPDPSIGALAQDRDGYVWVATGSAVVRYDGVEFKAWTHRADDPWSAPSDRIRTMLVDAQGRVWGGGDDGLARYDPARDGFVHWRHDAKAPDSLGGDQVGALAQDSEGTLWVGLDDDGGLDRLTADGRFTHERHDPANPRGLADGSVRALLPESDGRLWVGTGAGVDLRERDGSFRHTRFEGDDGHALDPPQVFTLARANGDVLVGTVRGLFRLGRDGIAHHVPLGDASATPITSIVSGDDGGLWLGTTRGLVLRDRNGNTYRFDANQLLPHALSGHIVLRLLRDREGGLWLGTDNGLAYLAPDWNDFTRSIHRPDDPASLSPGTFAAVAASADGRLWVANQDGVIDKLDPATQAVQPAVVRLPGAHHDIYGMAEDSRGRLWVNASNGSFRYERGRLDAIAAPAVAYAVELDDAGTAYMNLVPQGTCMVPADSARCVPLPYADAELGATSNTDMRWSGHALWIATDKGLGRWEPGRPARYVEGVEKRLIRAIDVRGDDVWVADGDSLSVYRWRDGRAHLLAHHPFKDPHAVNNVMSVRADGLGRAWLFTRGGLWLFDPADGSLRGFGLEHGLVDTYFGSNAMARQADGWLYVPSKDGIVGFRPEAIRTSHRPPQVRLSSVSVRGHRGERTLSPDGSAMLAWNDRDLTIVARALSFIAPERNVYRFRLDGFDSGWVDAGRRGDRTFTQLPGGDYALHVQAAGPDGAWGEIATPLRIHVDRPPWLRWWAWLTYVALLALLFMALLAALRRRQAQRHRLELITQQHQLAQAANRAKTQVLAELGHEIRTPMTGVLGMAELLLSRPLASTERRYAQTIRNSGEVLLTLVNDALDLARIEAGRLQLTPAPFDPSALLHDVAELQRGKAANKELALRVHVGENVPPHVSGDAVRVRQILANLTSNALKFTERGEVSLSLHAEPGGLRFTVSDTGPGIAPADQAKLFQHYQQLDSPQRGSGSGLGLAICRELTTLMGGRIELDSSPGTAARSACTCRCLRRKRRASAWGRPRLVRAGICCCWRMTPQWPR